MNDDEIFNLGCAADSVRDTILTYDADDLSSVVIDSEEAKKYAMGVEVGCALDAFGTEKKLKTLVGQCDISESQYSELLRAKGNAEAVKEFALRQALRNLIEAADIMGLTDWHEDVSVTGNHTFYIKLDILT